MVTRTLRANVLPGVPATTTSKPSRRQRLCAVTALFLLSACGGGPVVSSRATLNSRYSDEQPSLSSNGRFLAFVSDRHQRREILLYDLQAQQFVSLPNLRGLTFLPESPSLSATARYLVYTSVVRGRSEVQLYDQETQRPLSLTATYDGLVRRPSVSPDGRYVTFETSRRGQWDVEVIDRGPEVELDTPATPTR